MWWGQLGDTILILVWKFLWRELTINQSAISMIIPRFDFQVTNVIRVGNYSVILKMRVDVFILMTLGFPQAMKLILQKLGPVTETETQLSWILVGETLKNMVKSTVCYIHKEHFGIFFECLQVSSNFSGFVCNRV